MVVFSGFLGKGQTIWINQKITASYLGEEKTVYFTAKGMFLSSFNVNLLG